MTWVIFILCICFFVWLIFFHVPSTTGFPRYTAQYKYEKPPWIDNDEPYRSFGPWYANRRLYKMWPIPEKWQGVYNPIDLEMWYADNDASVRRGIKDGYKWKNLKHYGRYTAIRKSVIASNRGLIEALSDTKLWNHPDNCINLSKEMNGKYTPKEIMWALWDRKDRNWEKYGLDWDTLGYKIEEQTT